MRGITSPGRRQLEGLSQPTPDGGWSGGPGGQMSRLSWNSGAVQPWVG